MNTSVKKKKKKDAATATGTPATQRGTHTHTQHNKRSWAVGAKLHRAAVSLVSSFSMYSYISQRVFSVIAGERRRRTPKPEATEQPGGHLNKVGNITAG